jgi:hypothetical protein
MDDITALQQTVATLEANINKSMDRLEATLQKLTYTILGIFFMGVIILESTAQKPEPPAAHDVTTVPSTPPRPIPKGSWIWLVLLVLYLGTVILVVSSIASICLLNCCYGCALL